MEGSKGNNSRSINPHLATLQFTRLGWMKGLMGYIVDMYVGSELKTTLWQTRKDLFNDNCLGIHFFFAVG